MTPILDQVRREARREALQSYRSQLADAEACEVQDAYQRGRYDGHRNGHISEGRWWCIGVLCGIALSVLVWRVWP